MPLDQEEIMEIIESMKNHKAPDSDEIPAEILKYEEQAVKRWLEI